MNDSTSPDAPQNTLTWKLFNLEPAVWRGVVTAVFVVLAAVGIKVSDDVPDLAFMCILALLPVVQGLWTKGAVTPNAKVVVRVDDPVGDPNKITAGEAVVDIDYDKFGAEARTNQLVELAGTRGVR